MYVHSRVSGTPPATRNLPRKAAPPDLLIRRRGAEVRIHGWPVRVASAVSRRIPVQPAHRPPDELRLECGQLHRCGDRGARVALHPAPGAADLIPHEPVRARPDT